MKRCFIKYCTECSYNFSHRSAYLRHMKNIHGIFSTDLHPPYSVQVKQTLKFNSFFFNQYFFQPPEVFDPPASIFTTDEPGKYRSSL